MKDEDKHESVPFFEHLRASSQLPAPAAGWLDVALLETGADRSAASEAMVAAVETASGTLVLESSGLAVRLISFAVGRGEVPEPGRFRLLLAAGEGSEPVPDEAMFTRLLDSIVGDDTTAMLVTGGLFDGICRWAEVAVATRRSERTSAATLDRLSREALTHPWFAQFAHELPDHQHFPVVDTRLSDVILEDAGKTVPIAFDAAGVSALTMLEIARSVDGVMPRFLATCHHPQLAGSGDRLFSLTAYYTLLEPLRHQLRRLSRDSTHR